MSKVVVEQEFDDWLQHNVTKAFFKSLSNNREELKEGLVLGHYAESLDEVRGRCAAVQNILNMSYEDLVEGLRYGK